MAEKDKKVTIYSTPTCIYCNLAKDHFDENGIIYEDFDVGSNMEKREEMVGKSGQMGVPVIEIGNQVIVGFDQERIDQELGITTTG